MFFNSQVFFCVIIASMAIGNASPNLQVIGQARGAAYFIWNIIDRVNIKIFLLIFIQLPEQRIIDFHLEYRFTKQSTFLSWQQSKATFIH